MSKSIGYTRGTSGLQAIFRKNRMFMHSLRDSMQNANKKLLAAGAAQVLHNSVMSTKNDSSRAAANWNLSFGGGQIAQEWDPLKYLDPVNMVGRIGDRGDNRGPAGAAQISAYKGMYYGYTEKAGVKVPVPGGLLWEAIKVGEKGTPPRITVYNPIYSPRWAPYARNAFDDNISIGVSDMEVSRALKEVGAGLIPGLIHSVLSGLKSGGASKAGF